MSCLAVIGVVGLVAATRLPRDTGTAETDVPQATAPL
jgi:hypothetical protein